MMRNNGHGCKAQPCNTLTGWRQGRRRTAGGREDGWGAGDARRCLAIPNGEAAGNRARMQGTALQYPDGMATGTTAGGGRPRGRRGRWRCKAQPCNTLTGRRRGRRLAVARTAGGREDGGGAGDARRCLAIPNGEAAGNRARMQGTALQYPDGMATGTTASGGQASGRRVAERTAGALEMQGGALQYRTGKRQGTGQGCKAQPCNTPTGAAAWPQRKGGGDDGGREDGGRDGGGEEGKGG